MTAPEVFSQPSGPAWFAGPHGSCLDLGEAGTVWSREAVERIEGAVAEMEMRETVWGVMLGSGRPLELARGAAAVLTFAPPWLTPGCRTAARVEEGVSSPDSGMHC